MSTLVAEVREAMSLPAPGVARAIREAADVSRVRLGAELGVGELAVYRWETGQRSPRGSTRLAYARLLRELAAATRNPGEPCMSHGGPQGSVGTALDPDRPPPLVVPPELSPTALDLLIAAAVHDLDQLPGIAPVVTGLPKFRAMLRAATGGQPGAGADHRPQAAP